MEVLSYRVRAGQLQNRPLHIEFSAGHPGILTIEEPIGRQRVQEKNYYAWRLDASFGHAVRLEKFFSERRPDEPVQYDVLISDEASSCECKGFLRWGHCLHISAVRALMENGDI